MSSVQIWQLAGYVLLDYSNQHRISSAGWYQARTGWLGTWELDEFLALLGAHRPLARLRTGVRKVLQNLDTSAR